MQKKDSYPIGKKKETENFGWPQIWRKKSFSNWTTNKRATAGGGLKKSMSIA